eukprot:5559184-Prymnesium_polylepis.2
MKVAGSASRAQTSDDGCAQRGWACWRLGVRGPATGLGMLAFGRARAMMSIKPGSSDVLKSGMSSMTSRWMKRSTSSRSDDERPVRISSSLVKTERRDQ